MKQTAVDYLFERLSTLYLFKDALLAKRALEEAKAMEKEQIGYSKEDVVKIVEKSRETGLTAEYLLLTFKSE